MFLVSASYADTNSPGKNEMPIFNIKSETLKMLIWTKSLTCKAMCLGVTNLPIIATKCRVLSYFLRRQQRSMRLETWFLASCAIMGFHHYFLSLYHHWELHWKSGLLLKSWQHQHLKLRYRLISCGFHYWITNKWSGVTSGKETLTLNCCLSGAVL